MCGRINEKVTVAQWQRLREMLGVRGIPLERPARFNVPPSAFLPVIIQEGSHRELHDMRWGLIAPWAKEGQITHQPINARADGIRTKPMFRAAFAKRRGVVVVSGFYEWQKSKVGKIPYRIYRKDEEPLLMAALWERRGPSDAPIETVAIVTTDANDLVRQIHDRMPVILTPEAALTWLNPETPLDVAESLLIPDASSELAAYPISTRVNSPANDDEELWTPAI